MASEAAPRRAVRNIAEIVALEQEEIRRRPPSSQLADAAPHGPLGGFFSLEGVLVAAFVLMKQNRADARAEEWAHLDPRISLLAVTTAGGLASRLHETLHPEERDDGSA